MVDEAPASGVVEYVTHRFESAFFNQTEYMGYPNDEKDKLWEDISTVSDTHFFPPKNAATNQSLVGNISHLRLRSFTTLRTDSRGPRRPRQLLD
jgi:hypothetical protein